MPNHDPNASAAANRRLQAVAAAASSDTDIDPDALPAGGHPPASSISQKRHSTHFCRRPPLGAPNALTDDQLAGFIQNGFVALPVPELPQEWHAEFAHDLFRSRFGGTSEEQPGSGLLHSEQLTTLLATPTVRGALGSVLGP